MTTVAMVAGMIPVALSLTGESSFRGPMGVTVIGGLIFSTVLTLLIVPASFSMAVDVETWIGKKFGKLLDNGEPHQASAEPLPAE
jgi:Cu/Ag efflux pump CusA